MVRGNGWARRCLAAAASAWGRLGLGGLGAALGLAAVGLAVARAATRGPGDISAARALVALCVWAALLAAVWSLAGRRGEKRR